MEHHFTHLTHRKLSNCTYVGGSSSSSSSDAIHIINTIYRNIRNYKFLFFLI